MVYAGSISQDPILSPLSTDVVPALRGGLNIGLLVGALASTSSGYGTSPAAVTYHVNASTGSDTNLGTTSGAALATLGEALKRVGPIVLGPTIIEITGNVADASSLGWPRDYQGHLCLRGAPVDVLTGLTAISVSDVYTQLSGAAWSANQYRGYALLATSGANQGLMRMIRASTTINVVKTDAFPNAIAPGDTFKIVDFPKLTVTNALTVKSGPAGFQRNPHLILFGVQLDGTYAFDGAVSLYGVNTAPATTQGGISFTGKVFAGTSPSGSISWAVTANQGLGLGLGQRGANNEWFFRTGSDAVLRGSVLTELHVYGGKVSCSGVEIVPIDDNHSCNVAYGGSIDFIGGSRNWIDMTSGSFRIEEQSAFYFVDPDLVLHSENPSLYAMRVQGARGELGAGDAFNANIWVENGSNVQLNVAPIGSGQFLVGTGAIPVPFSRLAVAGDEVAGSFGTISNTASTPSEFAAFTFYGPRHEEHRGPRSKPGNAGEALTTSFQSGAGTFALPSGVWVPVSSFSCVSNGFGDSSAGLLAKVNGSGVITALRGSSGFAVNEDITIAEIGGVAVAGASPVWRVTSIAATALATAFKAGSTYINTLYGYRFRTDASGAWVTGEANSGW